MSKLTELKEWNLLRRHHDEIASQHMRDWFEQDKERFSQFHLQCGDILLDYSRNRINAKTVSLLSNLAQAVNLKEKIEALFNGRPVNVTETRAALHTALRDPAPLDIRVNDENISPQIRTCQQDLRDFVTQMHHRSRMGITGKPLSQVVNIGIGGSHLGPMMATHALKDFAVADLDIHFAATVDDQQLNDVLQQLNPETTLFIISSKSFSTIETLTNARSALQWMQEKLGPDVIRKHFMAVTANREKVLAFGIPQEHIFPMWDWIGGRYSIWSAVGLPIMLMIGNEHFADFLMGAHEMDLHFRQSAFSQNMPVLLAMLSIWYTNFFGSQAQAIVPYTHRLRYLVPYLQQAEMESSGKSVALNSDQLFYTTGSVIFGEEGCSGQHAYHQLLHQGSHLIPVDFIFTGLAGQKDRNLHQDLLLASCLSQAKALMCGKSYEECYQALLSAHYSHEQADTQARHQMIPGNKPSNLLILKSLNPKNLGALIALYEHKIFVQSCVWGINPFDQWGVELGKQLLPSILKHIQHPGSQDNADSAETAIVHYLNHQNIRNGDLS